MKLESIDLEDKKMGREIERFLDFTGHDYWKKAIEKIDAVEGKFYKELYLFKKNPLARYLKQYFLLTQQGKCIWKHKSPDLINLARHVFIVNRVVYGLNDNGKKHIKGRLRDEGGIRPFLFELGMATHFFRHGLNVVFSEYETSGASGKTFEFLVTGDGIEREVECKWKNVDAGRKVTGQGFYILCDEIYKQVAPKIQGKKCLVELICDKNLTSNQNILIKISESILEGIVGGKQEVIYDENFRIKIYYLPDSLAIKSDEQFASAVAPYCSGKDSFSAFVISDDDSTIIVTAESEEKDKVLNSIYEELKGAIKQFTKTKLALIACCLEGISSSQWKELAGVNGLSKMTSRLLSQENTTHVHTISYTSEPEPHIIGHIMDFKSDTLFFPNPNCLYHRAEDIFFLKTQRDLKIN